MVKHIRLSESFLFFIILFSIGTPFLKSQSDSVLMFVSHENTYYSEYIVMIKALQTSGYIVDVRSSSSDSASTYMLPSGTDIEETAGTLLGGSYPQFTQQFENLFGSSWNASWDETPSYIPVNGRIQDVPDMSSYAALVIIGGTGAQDYRVDGSYNSQGSGLRLVSTADIQASAEKLNALALEALAAGKPVLAQCHGASLASFWRIPGTSGPGEEVLGYSLLKDHFATGFPEPQTATTLSSLNVNYREFDRITISSPHSSFDDDDNGEYKIITTRDWYPQTVAHAARTLINIITTYPGASEMLTPVSILILHGGAVNTGDCGPGNRANDIPCNYGGGANIPADYTDIQNLLEGNSANDVFNFTVDEVNITDGGFPASESAILTYLNQYNVIVFYKHWSTGVTDELQNAIVTYADEGGGVLALHHGLYNDIDGALSKNILVNQLFGAESAMNTWSGNLTNYNLFQTNYGHFVSTYGLSLPDALETPSPWYSNPLISNANASYSYYQRFGIYDEIYNNMAFIPGQTFGDGINQVNPIFSNDQNPDAQCHTSGFVKLFNPSADGSIGKAAYYEAGERKESININHAYGQVIRNTIFWLSSSSPVLPIELVSFRGQFQNNAVELFWNTASETNNYGFEIERKTEQSEWQMIGFVEGAGNSNAQRHYSYNDLSAHKTEKYFYRLKQVDADGSYSFHDQIEINTGNQPEYSLLQNYPNPFNPETSIEFMIPKSGLAVLIIYNALGEEVKTLFNDFAEAGKYQKIKFNAAGMPSGLYVVKLRFEDPARRATKQLINKMLLLK